MCGIAGEVRFDDQRPDLAALDRATQSMDRRGPDASGLHAQGRVAFGHRRLKIIDLTDAAQQPLADAELGLTVVFNGCIYNFRELRAELAAGLPLLLRRRHRGDPQGLCTPGARTASTA
jgi:asparagine synthase (glutamine-hydrolysing)